MNLIIVRIFSESLYSIFSNVIVFMAFDKLYGRKYNNSWIYWVAFILWTSGMFFVNSYKIAPVNLLYQLFVSEFICLFLYRTTFKKSWLYNLLVVFIIVFSDTITYILWTIVFDISYEEIGTDYYIQILSNLLNIIVLYFMIRVFLIFEDKNGNKEINLLELLFVSTMNIFELFFLYRYMKLISSKKIGSDVVIILIGILFFYVYITYITKKTSEFYENKYEMELLKKQNEMQLNSYKDIEHKYEESRKIIHDVKKHISVLNELNNIDKNQSVNYGRMLEKKFEKIFCDFHCSNPILSIIISNKLTYAESHEINVNLCVEDIDLSFMSELDITGIFSNLWDNSIEACLFLKTDRRFIVFEIRRIRCFILICMKNSFDPLSLQAKSGSLITSKKGHMGLGFEVISSLVKKYSGILEYSTERNTFEVNITIPI